MNTENAAVLSF